MRKIYTIRYKNGISNTIDVAATDEKEAYALGVQAYRKGAYDISLMPPEKVIASVTLTDKDSISTPF